jgi:hypothetical protein
MASTRRVPQWAPDGAAGAQRPAALRNGRQCRCWSWEPRWRPVMTVMAERLGPRLCRARPDIGVLASTRQGSRCYRAHGKHLRWQATAIRAPIGPMNPRYCTATKQPPHCCGSKSQTVAGKSSQYLPHGDPHPPRGVRCVHALARIAWPTRVFPNDHMAPGTR